MDAAVAVANIKCFSALGVGSTAPASYSWGRHALEPGYSSQLSRSEFTSSLLLCLIPNRPKKQDILRSRPIPHSLPIPLDQTNTAVLLSRSFESPSLFAHSSYILYVIFFRQIN